MQRPISKAEFAKRCGISGGAVTKLIKGRLSVAMIGDRIDFAHAAAQEYYLEKTAARPEPVQIDPDVLLGQALEHCRSTERWTASSIQRHLSIGYARAQKILGQLQALGHVPGSQLSAVVGPSGQAPAPPPPPKAPRQHGKGKKSSWSDDAQIVEVPEDIEGLADMTIREAVEKFGTGYRMLDWLRALKEIEAVNEKRIKNAQSMGRLIARRLVEVGVIDPFNSAHVRLMTDGAKAVTAAVLAKHQAGVSEQEIEAYVSDVIGSFIRPVKSKVERNLGSLENATTD